MNEKRFSDQKSFIATERIKRDKEADMKENRDHEILHLLRTQPEEGIKQAMEAYGGPVMTICRNILFDCSREDREEAVADSFVGLWRSAESFREEAEYSLKSYLYGIARHTALDKRRRLKKQAAVLPIEEALIESSADLESEYAQKLNAHILHDSVNEMEEPDRSIFILRYFYFEKVKDIAARLGLAPKAVENRLYYGKSKLRQALAERGI